MSERVCLCARAAVEITGFSLCHKLDDSADRLVLPLPFLDNEKRPEPARICDTPPDTYRVEGLILSGSKDSLVIGKQPCDRDAGIELILIDGESFVGGAAYSNFRCGDTTADRSSRAGFAPLRLNAGDEYDFGVTRYRSTEALTDAFYAYRRDMKEWGVGLPDGYEPPLNYCLYYEHPANFTREELLETAKLAADIGCGLLYTDQGWETSFGSTRWDTDRLGPPAQLVADTAALGLKLGVLVGLHSHHDSLPQAMYIKNSAGEVTGGDPWHPYGVCPCSEEYKKLRKQSLFALADSGVYFYSFDFNNNDFPCYSGAHGHSVPNTDVEHAAAIADIQQALKEYAAPGSVLVEAHDWADSGNYRFPITSFLRGNHERWGFEYMWEPLADYLSGRTQNLYYYNLAYEKPLYLHIDLAGGGDNAEVFWYFAGMIRHLGIGNFTRLDEAHQTLFRDAIGKFNTIRPILSRGEFIGADPLAFAHALDGKAVVMLFSDSEKSSVKKVVFGKASLGLPEKISVTELWGHMSVTQEDGRLTASAEFDGPAAAVALLG